MAPSDRLTPTPPSVFRLCARGHSIDYVHTEVANAVRADPSWCPFLKFGADEMDVLL